MSFKQLGLSDEIQQAIVDQGYTEPTPIQVQAIPPILESLDIMGCAQTGTGKTAGFTLPMLHRLQIHANNSTSPAKHPIRALILVPTRELAAQVYESVRTYGKYLALRSAVVYGGVNMDPQIKALHAGIELLIATPGRLLDHVQQKNINLSKVEILVLDEADRMLDMGFMPDITRILTLLPVQRQSLMFSATFSEEIKKFANNLLKQPVLVEVAKQNTISELVTHIVHRVDKERKTDLLIQLLKSHNLKQVLVFISTKQGASRLVRQLQREEITATEIHGDKHQTQRTQALEDFKQGVAQVLVATDVAARGLDIEDLPHVINYELPNTPEDYIHRIGRTGRAGIKGNAISLVCADENELLTGIENLLKTKLLVEVIAGFEHTELSRSSPSSKQAKKTNVRTRPEQTSKTGLNTERNHDIRSPRSSKNTSRTIKHHSKPKDPIFTQPYTPSSSPIDTVSTDQTNTEENSFHKHYRHRNGKPLAALFVPPVISKQDK